MAVTRYDVKGLKELQKQLKTFDNDVIKKAVRTAAKAAMQPVFNRALNDAPVDKGNLRSTVKLSAGTSAGKGRGSNRIGWASVKAGGKSAPDNSGKVAGEYVLPVHYGTSRNSMPENPFLLLAFVGFHQQILADYTRVLSAETEKGLQTMAKRNTQG